mmetsp:Transcript_85926/g.152209  ORF Transcript_85926/g.152209 Transcript_85926/m.152209 type:complete len:147 (+) Transcript_85926:61-501(+)
MKCIRAVAVALSLIVANEALVSREHQPIYEAKPGETAKYYGDEKFAVSAKDDKPVRETGYRSAWDDCGGMGASATERMRGIAARIKGWAKPLKFVRNAAQDCGSVDQSGTVSGPGERIVYPGPEIAEATQEGLSVAAETLAKYGAK